MNKPSNYQPPYTTTPAIVNLVAEISEIIGRYTVLAEQRLTPRLRREEPHSHHSRLTGYREQYVDAGAGDCCYCRQAGVGSFA